MKIALGFEIKRNEGFLRSNRGENICIYSAIPNSNQFISISLDKCILDILSRLSDDSKKKTSNSLKEAVNNAVKNKYESGTFLVYLDKGAFDIED